MILRIPFDSSSVSALSAPLESVLPKCSCDTLPSTGFIIICAKPDYKAFFMIFLIIPVLAIALYPILRYNYQSALSMAQAVRCFGKRKL